MTCLDYANVIHNTRQQTNTRCKHFYRPSYLNQGEDFILNDCGGVVFRGDDFNEYAINKVPASDQSMKTMAAVLHARLQDLMDAERKPLSEYSVNQLLL